MLGARLTVRYRGYVVATEYNGDAHLRDYHAPFEHRSGNTHG